MARLIYTAITSLDLYIADSLGNFDWAEPDLEVHQAVNDLERPIGTYLYGRRLYDVMRVWQTLDTTPHPPTIADYASIWRGADKIVFSRFLDAVDTPKTRIERAFDPAAIRALKQSSTRDIGIGGAILAAEALRAGLVDECHLFLNPIVVGGGRRALPNDLRWPLALVDLRRFANGVVHLHYRTRA